MEAVASSQNRTGIVKDVPSDWRQVGIIARYDLLKHLRSKRLLGLLIIEAVILVAMVVLPLAGIRLTASDDAEAVVGVFVSFVNLLIVIGATLFAGDAIVSEFQGRTGYLLFPNPVKRWSIFLGKFLAAVAIMIGVLVIYYAVALLTALGITGDFSVPGIYSMLLAILSMVSAVSLGMFISSIMKGSTGALILTFAYLLLIDSIIVGMLTLAGIKPFFMLSFAGGVISTVLRDPYPVDFLQTVPIAEGQEFSIWNFFPDVGISIAVMAIYSAVLLVLALFFFRRREMVG